MTEMSTRRGDDLCTNSQGFLFASGEGRVNFELWVTFIEGFHCTYNMEQDTNSLLNVAALTSQSYQLDN